MASTCQGAPSDKIGCRSASLLGCSCTNYLLYFSTLLRDRHGPYPVLVLIMFSRTTQASSIVGLLPGSFEWHRSIRSCTSCGPSKGTESLRQWRSTGVSPVQNSHNTVPNDHMSLGRPQGSPLSCSGDAQPRLPAGASGTSVPASFLPKPKSAILQLVRSASSRIFEDLMSK